jgi:hypothetical protein
MSQLEVDKIIPQSGTTLTIGDSGDTVNFADGTSIGIDTNTLYIDSTNNRVGIGTSSPDEKLTVSGDMNVVSGSTYKIKAQVSSSYALNLGHDRMQIVNAASNPFLFYYGSTERMRIDSSGNLLVGKTSTLINDVGVQLVSSGAGGFTRDAGVPLNVNRKTDDGTIISVKKDGTEVGSIGVLSNRIYIGDSDTGLFIDDSNNAISPYSVTASNTVDNTIDLGISSKRYKDLYLGGGAYLGGTGTANKLDDYEEGTWTPTVDSGGITINTINNANYVKVGGKVTATCYLSIQGGDTSLLQIGGLPFTVGSTNYAVNIADFGKGGFKGAYGRASENATNLQFFVSSENTSTNRTQLVGNQVGTGYFIFSITYLTT